MSDQDYKPSDIMRWFDSAHIQSPTIKAWMKAMGNIAEAIDRRLAPGAEKATALRKLLEAKDATTRAVISTAEGAAIAVDDLIAPMPKGLDLPLQLTLRSACLSMGAHLLDALERRGIGQNRWTLAYDGNREIRCIMPVVDPMIKSRLSDQRVQQMRDWHLEVRVELSSFRRVHSVKCLTVKNNADPSMSEGFVFMRGEGILTQSEESRQPSHGDMAKVIAINLVTSLHEVAWKAGACPPTEQTFDSDAMEVARFIIEDMEGRSRP